MAVRPVHVLLISLLLYEHTSGDYCRNEGNPTSVTRIHLSSNTSNYTRRYKSLLTKWTRKKGIQFCQSGTISGSNVYINGSSVKTKEEINGRGCVCYLEQIGNRNIRLNAAGSCVYCGLQVTVGDVLFRSNHFDSQTYGWGSIVLNDTKFTMTMDLDGSTRALNTAFCITIDENKQDSSIVLNLTCEDLVARSSTAISTSPNVITKPPTMVPDTTKGMSPTSTETAIPPKIETTNPTVVIAGNTNATHGPNANITYRGITATTTTGNDLGEPRVHCQKEEIIVGAAVGGSCGGVVIVIVINVIIFICYKRRIKNKYMQRHSTAPARVYTELEFGSRDVQNDNHVYNSIEPQQIYNNNVQ